MQFRLMPLAVGNKAPAIELKDHNGVVRSLAGLGGRPLVLFFYPKDDSPGCTMEACSFRDNYASLQALGAEVWGVSGDGASSHRRFAERHQLPFPLLVDEGNRLREAFGVPRALLLLPGRATYVIDAKGVIQMVYSAMLDATAHVQRAQACLEALKA
jgi:peroxiredoxin Q/BCP